MVEILITNNYNRHTLPEREEDDGLYGEELQDRVERFQHLPGGPEEEEEAVEGETDREVVNDGDVYVAPVRAPVTVVVMASGLQ